MTTEPDPKQRFSSRVQDYVRFRPGYPDALIDALCEHGALTPGADVAELGSGTGIFTGRLLERGLHVFAVEPNDAMRTAAEQLLGADPGFTSVRGAAEATGLPEQSVDLVAAAQAFHWFDVRAARIECRRILRRGGLAALIWNERAADATPFLRELETLLQRFGTDYGQAVHRDYDETQVRHFFGAPFTSHSFPNAQELDLAGFIGRIRSASYAPEPGHPHHAPMLVALAELYAQHAERDRVRFLYTSRLYIGPLD